VLISACKSNTLPLNKQYAAAEAFAGSNLQLFSKERKALPSFAAMYSFTHTIRVRYAETDQMGYVYYGNYLTYYEVARVEALRALGVTYKEVEESGILMPVQQASLQYKRPARYDDAIDVTAIVTAMPTARFAFEFEVKRGEELLNTGAVTLVFVQTETGRPTRAPKVITDLLAPYF
jgi:acyl-CoA thioester hydrolase